MTFAPKQTFGRQIRMARERKGLSRTKLAEFAGIPSNSLIRYEKAGEEGGKYPSLIKAATICRLLDIDPRRAFDSLPLNDSIDSDIDFRFANHFFQQDFLLAKEHGWPDAMGPRFLEPEDQLRADVTAIRAILESGPDQSDPSRPSSSKHTEAAPTASDHHPTTEGSRDEPE